MAPDSPCGCRAKGKWECDDIVILLVDDEPTFRESLAENLRMDGHGVLEFGCPAELPPPNNLPAVHVVVADYETPGVDGLVFLDQLGIHQPVVPTILVSTHRVRVIEDRVRDRPAVCVAHKQIDYDKIHTLIHRLVES